MTCAIWHVAQGLCYNEVKKPKQKSLDCNSVVGWGAVLVTWVCIHLVL